MKSFSNTLIQFIKFGLVGISNTAITYFFMHWVFIGGSIISLQMLSVVGIINAYYWSNRYVFKLDAGEKRSQTKSFVKTFVAYSFTGLVIASALLWIYVDIFCISEYIALLLSLMITVPLNFIINKYWSFKTFDLVL